MSNGKVAPVGLLAERYELQMLMAQVKQALASGDTEQLAKATAALDELSEFVKDHTATDRIEDGYHWFMSQWFWKQWINELRSYGHAHNLVFTNPNSVKTMTAELAAAGIAQPYCIGNADVAAACFYRRTPEGMLPFYVISGHDRMLANAETFRVKRKRLKAMAAAKADDGAPLFEDGFLEYVRELDGLNVTIEAIRQGGVWFPHVPGVIVYGSVIQVLLMECEVLNPMGLSVATTAVTALDNAMPGVPKIDMAPRRAPSVERANDVARAARMGGFIGTSNTDAAFDMGENPYGSFAHFLATMNISWWRGKYMTSAQAEMTGMSVGTKFNATLAERLMFVQYAMETPGTSKTFLTDTLSTLRSGMVNLIHAVRYLMEKQKITKGYGRLDSGEPTYLVPASRNVLDQAGFDRKFIGVMPTDGITLEKINKQFINLPVDAMGIGGAIGNLPSSGLVYKLLAFKDADGNWIPCGKLTDDDGKEGPFGLLKPYRVYDGNGMARYDIIALHAEELPLSGSEIMIVNPEKGYDRKGQPLAQDVIKNFTVRPLLEPIMVNGKRTQVPQTEIEINEYRKQEITTLYAAQAAIGTKDKYRVNLTPKAHELHVQMVSALRAEIDAPLHSAPPRFRLISSPFRRRWLMRLNG